MKLSDLKQPVLDKLARRGDLDDARIYSWMAKAILELTQSYPFEELRTKGPVTNFQVGVYEYDVSTFINPAAPLVSAEKYSEMILWFVSLDTSGQSNVGFNLKYRSPQVVEPMAQISGIPCRWSRVGSKLIVGFNPQQAFTTWWRYQRQHPFTATGPTANDPIYMPDDWQEIIEYATAIRAASDLVMDDFVTKYHSILYGDPNLQRRDGIITPGLLAKRLAQRERDGSNNERQLVPVVARY